MHITEELEINYIMLPLSDILQHWEAAKSWNQLCSLQWPSVSISKKFFSHYIL